MEGASIMSPRVGLDRTIITLAAIELANTDGIDQVSLAALAKKLGVRSPSLYNHFQSLAELKTNIALVGLEKLEQSLIRSVLGKSGSDAIFTFSKQYLAFAKENPGLYEATIQPATYPDPHVQAASERLIELILQLLNSFKLEKTKALHFVRGLRSIVHGFASLDRSGGFQMNFDVEESLLFTVKLLCDGLERQHQ
jgi:AcrR family transcriptional regulator